MKTLRLYDVDEGETLGFVTLPDDQYGFLGEALRGLDVGFKEVDSVRHCETVEDVVAFIKLGDSS